MDKKYLIMGAIIITIIILCGCIGYLLFTDHTEYTTTTIAESGTTLEIPKDMAIKSTNTESGITVLENDNTIIVLYNSANKNLAQTIGFSDIKNPIFGSEFSGNITIDNPTVAGCSLEGKCNGVFIGNNNTHDNIIVISKNADIVNHIINSIKWGNQGNTTNDNSAASTGSNNDKTYPFYAEDGSVVGYYHVGDTVEYKEMIFKLQSNGQWVQIGESTGSGQQGYSNGYSQAIDDMDNYDDSDYDYDYEDYSSASQSSSSQSSSGSSSSSSVVETTNG